MFNINLFKNILRTSLFVMLFALFITQIANTVFMEQIVDFAKGKGKEDPFDLNMLQRGLRIFVMCFTFICLVFSAFYVFQGFFSWEWSKLLNVLFWICISLTMILVIIPLHSMHGDFDNSKDSLKDVNYLNLKNKIESGNQFSADILNAYNEIKILLKYVTNLGNTFIPILIFLIITCLLAIGNGVVDFVEYRSTFWNNSPYEQIDRGRVQSNAVGKEWEPPRPIRKEWKPFKSAKSETPDFHEEKLKRAFLDNIISADEYNAKLNEHKNNK